ncbi:MAG: hypothetical protein H6981_04615 [Gammaproteobacteria bacterium]|nr:hypothetical protein [Gammaproteobacteria bacterium]
MSNATEIADLVDADQLRCAVARDLRRLSAHPSFQGGARRIAVFPRALRTLRLHVARKLFPWPASGTKARKAVRAQRDTIDSLTYHGRPLEPFVED